MRMRVGDYGQFLFAAYCPELSESVAMQYANAGIVSVRIEIVIEHGFADLALFAVFNAKEERAGLVTAVAAPLKLGDDSTPRAIRAPEPMPWGYECPNNRSDGKVHRFAPRNK